MESHDALAFKNPNDSIVVALHNEQTTSAVTTLDVRGSVYELTIPAAGWVTVFVE
jgi:hypothetical protein